MRKIVEQVYSFIKDKSKDLRWIVGGALGIVSVLTLFLFSLINTASVRETLIKNSVTATEQSVHLSYLHLKNYHDELLRRGSTFADELQQVDQRNDSLSTKMTEIYQLNNDIVSVSLHNEKGYLESYAPTYLEETADTFLYEKSWYEFNPEDLQLLLSAPHIQDTYEVQPAWVVSLIKKIQINGERKTLVVDFDFSQVGDFFNRVAIGDRGYAYIADREGEVLYHPKRAQFSDEESDAIQKILTKGDGTYVTEDKNYSIGYRTVSHTGWKVVGVSYLEDTIIPALNETQRLTFYTLLVMLLLIVFLSFLVSKFISQPITRMVRQIGRAEQRDADIRIYETRFNEVRQLSESYNRQMDRIDELVEQIKQEQAELRKSEMNVLQAQINPHFLYNTLDSILWLAESGQNTETSEMVAALGRLLRISLSKGENLITLRQELNHAESYLTIQKYRYKDQFTYSIEADERLLDYLTVKIVIQPFLENALYHGIEHMVDPGHISISLFEVAEKIYLKIQDDGVGIDAQKLAHIQKLKEGTETGIGIRNVHQRLQVYFGKEYGVDIESELDEGTTVTIILPKIKHQKELSL